VTEIAVFAFTGLVGLGLSKATPTLENGDAEVTFDYWQAL